MRAAAFVALTVVASSMVRAQATTATEGAVNLLLPIGARAVGVGEAVIAHRGTSEALWWNPAGVGSLSRKEFALHHSQSFVGTGDALTLVVPSPLLGVLAIAFDLLNYGEQEANNGPNGPTGSVLPRNVILAATYGSMVGPDASAGITFKMVQLRQDCSGSCPTLQTYAASSYAVDFGMQYDLHRIIPVTVGAALRNVGPPLQVNDSPQSDPLPRRLQIGAEYRYVSSPDALTDTEVRIALDLLSDLKSDSPEPRMGAELAWQKRVFLRGGYVLRTRGSENGGPSIGLGYVARAITVDLARVFSGFSADAGQAPTYLSIRVQF